MSEVEALDRVRLLRSRREKRDGIVISRKRKLREFFAVCDTQEPIPNISYDSIDAPPTNPAEAKFLDVCDILQGRLFDEANLPQRRFLRSETSKPKSPTWKVISDSKTNDGSRKAAKIQRDGSRTRKSRATTPSSRSDAGQPTVEDNGIQGSPRQRSSSRGSQTDLPAESSAVLNEIVEETLEDATQPNTEIPDAVVPPTQLESDRIQTLGSPVNSPGVDPKQAMPISAEDVAESDEPLVEGLGSHDGEPHKALTAHLPPREIQEEHLRESVKARDKKEHLSINLPARDGGRAAEPMSSPGSTIGAHSAATPALHEASTDTSPENEGRYDADRMDEDDKVETPTELKKTPEEEAEKEEHDRIHQAQMDVAQAEILRVSPVVEEEPEAEEQVAQASNQRQIDCSQDEDDTDPSKPQDEPDALTQEAGEVVEDVEEQAHAENVPQPEEVVASPKEVSLETNVGPDPNVGSQPKPPVEEVADSEAEDQTPPADAMDVDARTVQDSFESIAPIEERTGTPLSPATVEPVQKSQNESKKDSVAAATSTPRKTPPTPAPAPPTVERMTTRVASGAMRHKSVSEILGEIPRPNTTASSERSATKGDSDSAGISNSPSRSTTPQSPGTRMRSLVEKAKDKERSKLSTVVFAKQPTRPSSNDNALMASGSQQSRDAKNDYFMPLFLATSSTSSRGVPSLDNLLATAHKTITTSNSYVPINENQTAKVLKRIYNLQNVGKWSLRQPKRSEEPQRPTTHWDVVLQEAKWMRTDFREERKWKMTCARNLAFACAEWYEAGPEDRKLLQVNASSPPIAEPKDVEMGEASADPTPDLVSSAEFDSPADESDEELHFSLDQTVRPTDIFGLQDDDVVFGLRQSPTTDKILDELPMYGAPLKIPSTEPTRLDLDPDRYWKREALPLSKYIEGRMELKTTSAPKKKSRFQYDEESDDEDEVAFSGGEQRQRQHVLPPESTEVALFNPEHKHIRDRIHAGHQFRPPSEYPMPLQSFFECRNRSEWTFAEDDQLKTHVKEYTYNWSLISNMLTSPSLFSSAAERRTPWECFERWITLEGLPADMQKTHYFRAYNNRLEAANRTVMLQAQAQQQQASANGQILPPTRRRSTTSVRVERRRQQKYLSMVDAMRKLAKKRETSAQKQQHAAGLAAMRKANEVPAPKSNMRTPQEFSKLKFEQGERMKEQYALLQQRQQAQARAVMQARLQGQAGQPALPNGTPQQRQPQAIGAQQNGTPTSGQNLTVPGQNRPRGPMPAQMAGQVPMQNGLRVPQPLMNGIPQAQMQGMQGQLPMPNPALDVGLVTQAHQISQQQRQAIQQRQQGQLPGPGQVHNSPPRNMNGMSPPNFPQMQNGNMMPFPNSNGISSPGSQGQAGSPRMGQPHQLGGPMISKMEEQLRQRHPNASPEQITRMVAEGLAKNANNQRQVSAQAAMNAAAGQNMPAMNGMPMSGMGMNGMGMNGNGMNGMSSMNGMNGMNVGNARIPPGLESSPQMYAQLLRQQQENQQKAQAAAAANAANNGGQGHQRSGSSNSGK